MTCKRKAAARVAGLVKYTDRRGVARYTKSGTRVAKKPAHNSNYVDITGQQFGTLIAVCCVGKERTTELWKFQCTCCAGFVVRRKGNMIHQPPKRCQVRNDLLKKRRDDMLEQRERRIHAASRANAVARPGAV